MISFLAHAHAYVSSDLLSDREIHGANQQIVALDARIPSLESDKKLAVSGMHARTAARAGIRMGWLLTLSSLRTGRNFKEAKRIAEEMKTASVQIEESKETVAALTEQVRRTLGLPPHTQDRFVCCLTDAQTARA
jgi:hypothetical protein